MPTRRILHLVGSPTSRFYVDLSEVYARACLDAVRDPSRYEFPIAHVAPDRTWRFPTSLAPEAIAAAEPFSLTRALVRIADLGVDLALPQMFCHAGMTTYRAVLDALELPYLGNPPLQMALGADKAVARSLVAAAGVAVPQGELLRRGDVPTLAPPVVVKPATADNSDGVSLVTDANAFSAALDHAFAFAPTVLVEAYVPLGREVRCGVVAYGHEPRALPLEEYAVDPIARPIRRREDKLVRDDADALVLAAKSAARSWIVAPGDPIVPRVHAAAKLAYAALGCEQYGLFDFRIDPAGHPWFLEAGLYCSFAPASVVVTMMAAAGTSLATFFDDAVEATIAAHARRERDPTSVHL